MPWPSKWVWKNLKPHEREWLKFLRKNSRGGILLPKTDRHTIDVTCTEHNMTSINNIADICQNIFSPWVQEHVKSINPGAVYWTILTQVSIVHGSSWCLAIQTRIQIAWLPVLHKKVLNQYWSIVQNQNQPQKHHIHVSQKALYKKV